MKSVYRLLQQKLAGAERLAVLGVGSTLRADDAAGMYIVEKLRKAFDTKAYPGLLFCPGETAPENFTGKIAAFRPTHMLVVDAADVGRAPGDIVEIRPEDIGGPTFCSHLLPLRVMIRYLVDETGVQTLLLGIQSRSVVFDGAMTPEVKAAADRILRALRRWIRLRSDGK